MHSKYEKKEPKIMLRLVSLLLALLLWVNYSGRVDISQTVNQRSFPDVLLTYKNMPENIKIMNDRVVMLHVTVSGPDKELESLSATDIIASISLDGSQRGERTLGITADNISLPPRYKGVKVENVVPDIVNLTLEHITRKKVKLLLTTTGLPAADFEILDERVTPSEVTLEGPTNLVQDLTLLIGRPVDIEGATQTVAGSFRLADTLPRGSYLLESLSDLRYEIVIREKQRTIKVPEPFELDIETDASDADQWAEWDIPKEPLTLTYSGPIRDARWFDPTWVRPAIRLSSANVSYPTPEPLETPEGIEPPPEEVQTEPNKALFSIANRWQVPEEIQEEYPDWLDRVSRLTLSWEPEQVEVTKP